MTSLRSKIARASTLAIVLLLVLGTGLAPAEDIASAARQAARTYLEANPDHPLVPLLEDPDTRWRQANTIEQAGGLTTLAPLEVELISLGESVLAGRSRGNLLRLYDLLERRFGEIMGLPSVSTVAPRPTPEIRRFVADTLAEIDTDVRDLIDAAVLQELAFNPIAECSDEVGYEFGGDDGEDSDRCLLGEYADDGLMANVDFPLKDDLTCVKSQGTRGTCVAHAIAAAVETTVMVEGGSPENLSEQDLYFEGKTQVAGQSDPYLDGLWPGLTLAHLDDTDYPFQLEAAWNYNRSPDRAGPIFLPDPTFFNSCSADYWGELCTDLAFQGTELPVPGQLVAQRPAVPATGAEEITSTIRLPIGPPFDIDATLGSVAGLVSVEVPVIVSFSVTSAFRNEDPDGYARIIPPQPIQGGHAALIVGFVPNDSLPPGVAPAVEEGFFILKNSWSAADADCGFIYVDWAYLATYASGFDLIEID